MAPPGSSSEMGGTPISGQNSVRLSTLRDMEKMRQVYANPVELSETFTDVHRYHINSISQSADSESLISADDTTVMMWNIERSASGAQNRDGEAD